MYSVSFFPQICTQPFKINEFISVTVASFFYDPKDFIQNVLNSFPMSSTFTYKYQNFKESTDTVLTYGFPYVPFVLMQRTSFVFSLSKNLRQILSDSESCFILLLNEGLAGYSALNVYFCLVQWKLNFIATALCIPPFTPVCLYASYVQFPFTFCLFAVVQLQVIRCLIHTVRFYCNNTTFFNSKSGLIFYFSDPLLNP